MAGVAEEIGALRGTRPATIKDLLTHPSYSRLWRAMLVSSLGDWVGFVAVAALVVEPRFDRRKVMVGADIGRGLGYASMPFLPNLWTIFLLSFLIECLSLLWTPAKDASVPNLVPRRQLSNANSVGLVTTYGTLPLGAAIYTALVGVATVLGSRVGYFGVREHRAALALWADAFTFLFSARMVWGLDLRPKAVTRIRAAAVPKLNRRALLDGVKA